MILVEILDDLLDVASTLLALAGNLSPQPFDDVLRASNQVARMFLNFARDISCEALHLVFVHG